jgi:uncharacterized protein (TIGR02466 family)
MVTHELFPVIVGEYNLNRDFSDNEKETFRSLNEMKYNIGNLTTTNRNILEIKNLKNLKNKLTECASDYINKIIKPKSNINSYITQSWINFTNRGQYHHKHNHSNSFLSGVLYIHANKELDRITFHNGRYSQIDVQPMEYNRLNSSSWKIGVNTKDIFIFPSHLIHEVETSINEDSRISLSFNIFISGKIGDYFDMTELYLK